MGNIEDINGLAGVSWATSKLARATSKLASVGKLIKILIYIYIFSTPHDVGQITLRLGDIALAHHSQLAGEWL